MPFFIAAVTGVKAKSCMSVDGFYHAPVITKTDQEVILSSNQCIY